MAASPAFSWLLAFLCTFRDVSAVYLPGLSPREYDEGMMVPLKVNKLTSAKTQLPFAYYKMPFCGKKADTAYHESLGETLMGDKIEVSAYDVRVPINSTCQLLCVQNLSNQNKKKLSNLILDDYKINWLIDGLPAATLSTSPRKESRSLDDGFPVGVAENKNYFLNNHVVLYLLYHSNPDKYSGYRIVGFVVEPRSIVHKLHVDESGTQKLSCESVEARNRRFNMDEHREVMFTYDVRWAWSEIRWASRWDLFLQVRGASFHWFSLINSTIVVLVLAGSVAMTLLRILHRDISNYNEVPTADDAEEITGWKLLHADVFRKPNHSMMLCVSVGSGVQILGMCIVTNLAAVAGLLSPARRGQLLQCMLLLFTGMGVFAGYTAARLCKVFDGDVDRSKRVGVLTGLGYPGFFFLVFFVLNLFLWANGSSGAVPFATFFAIIVLWFGVSLPLVLLGAREGFSSEAIELPVKVNQIPRDVPETPWYAKTRVVCAVSGILPFGAVFTELFFIMDSVWKHHFYYLFGFLFLVLAILLIMCIELSITIVYLKLTSEDPRWWWTSFFSCASSGLYVFLYSIAYYRNSLSIDRIVPTILYFGYMALASIMFALLTGSIGLLASFKFVRAIYGSIKVD
eukprot:TRINITY_DN1310_c0_g2_i2.p1 TRINITY_DN1310_c0_g2~~TRINITY_DN1310_c0_g2_i2.p1  ORF type:complete len:635 (-),score=64.20 TRINITY_DN1310_c0_g2_i2:41-1921(-)